MKIGGIEFEPIRCELVPWYEINWEKVHNYWLTLPKKEYPIIELTEEDLTWEIIVNYECSL